MKKNNKKIEKIDARNTNVDKFLSKNPKLIKLRKIEEKFDNIFQKSWFFIILVSMLGGGVVLGTVLYVKYKVGAFNEIFVVEMLSKGLTTGEWAAVTAFAVGFLIARVLEGPLVGILDIGGSILTGIGIGLPSVFLASSATNHLMHNPWFGILIGLGAGALIGSIIILVRIFAKKGLKMNLGTDVMMGAGNQTGAFLGPLVIITSAMVNPIVGLGAIVGSITFYIFNKPFIGGAILGAMIFGIIPAFL